ncbi:MAG TPA: D-2-hydroxyacid dehydrogenase [Xanthobacteraceae bacterium]|nr:D-2-hydroxyacid dehydrogenase [Xanthobacteraceae bacterium]
MPPFPDRENLTICFAHVAYRLGDRFVLRKAGLRHVEVRTRDELEARIADAHVLVVSGLWRDELIERAPKLRFIQSIGAGVDQFDRDALRARGVRLASAQGVNERAVAEHAMALILALMRHLPAARDDQRRRHWRGMISDPARREDELGGKTLLIVGLGRIGSRLAGLARAFGMQVIGAKRDPATGAAAADQVVAQDRLADVLPQADIVALTCPLTPQTEKLIGESALRLMKPSAYLVNVARGRVVDEPALIAALEAGRIAGAALDCTVEEPLPPSSPLWGLDNVLITPHTAGETRRYEDNVIDVLTENLERLWRGETELKNQAV